MQRREFIALLGRVTAASAVCPLAALAQTKLKIPRIGYIGAGDPVASEQTFGAFRQGLTELGYVEGQTIALEVRWAEGRTERIPEIVTELIGLKVDVLVTGWSAIALVAK